WDRKQHNIPVRGKLALRVPDSIEAVIIVLPFGCDSVQLYAQWIDDELIAALAVVKSIQKHPNRVIARDVFTLGHMGADLIRVILTDKDGIEILVVVTQVNCSWLADRVAVSWVPLAQVRYLNQISPLPVFEEFLQFWGSGNSRND